MADVLFDFGKYNLKIDASIKLAKLAEIMGVHPSLQLAIEGHTDNIGSDEANVKLSNNVLIRCVSFWFSRARHLTQ